MVLDAHRRLLSACLRLMRPIARLLLATGMSFDEFDRVCRLAFIQVASEDFGIRGRKTNTARISAMTGIPRKEVARLRDSELQESADLRAGISPITDIMRTWATDEQYLDPKGTPLPLHKYKGDVSFDSLVGSVAADLTSGAVRKELLRLGAVEEDSHGFIYLTRRVLIPDTVDENLITAISMRLAGMAETIAHNICGRKRGSAGRFERGVESRPLDEAEVVIMRAIVRARLEGITEEFDELLCSGPASQSDGPRRRVSVGFYYFE